MAQRRTELGLAGPGGDLGWFKTASEEIFADEGLFDWRSFHESGRHCNLKARVTDVHKPLVAASRMTGKTMIATFGSSSESQAARMIMELTWREPRNKPGRRSDETLSKSERIASTRVRPKALHRVFLGRQDHEQPERRDRQGVADDVELHALRGDQRRDCEITTTTSGGSVGGTDLGRRGKNMECLAMYNFRKLVEAPRWAGAPTGPARSDTC